jgi:hypothetical protein
MQYFQAPDKGLWALPDGVDHTTIECMPAGIVPITDAQYAALCAPTTAQIEAQYNGAVQAMLDAYAQSMRYDSMLSMSTYVNSSNAQFKAESTAALAWRDAVWASAYTTLAAVQAGTQPMPASVAAFLATLPAHP